MEVILNSHTELYICSKAIRKCWKSEDKSDSVPYEVDVALDDISDFHLNGKILKTGDKDKELIERVGNKYKHSSTLEHLVYSFEIIGISRACLQELARHRIASLSVQSTRYTLKRLKEEESFYPKIGHWDKRLSEYLVVTGDNEVDYASALALENLRLILKKGKSVDYAKYCLPESYKTELVWTINARSLQNFLSLRSSKSALWEIRKLAKKIYEALPKEHQYLFKNNLNENESDKNN